MPAPAASIKKKGALSPHFTLSVQCRLASSHILPGCPPCDRLHGHTWTVRAFWSFESLDEHGMGANFRDLKDVLRREVHDRFDHRHLNDLPPFDRVAPTAENLAREVYGLLRERFDPGPRGRLVRVEVWEGPEACAAYED
jgi:6-pyruvoyltetrahydropterin/6-carboxytetrahydropterin synthase